MFELPHGIFNQTMSPRLLILFSRHGQLNVLVAAEVGELLCDEAHALTGMITSGFG